MRVNHRVRRAAAFGCTVAIAFLLAGCQEQYPNTTFEPNSEFGRQIDRLWSLMLYLGTGVFILVEAILIYTIWRYRTREGAGEPAQHVHGNTTLEIAWTVIPAVILVIIAIPTVRTIFRTQQNAPADGLQVQVIGHQWWWEFRYPQYGFVTANELYLPKGRAVNFELTTVDVLHSFWVPQLGGKRDLITNRKNYLWYTPDSGMATTAWNGFCAEYCGDSHANMKFRAFTVSPDEFESWAAHQKSQAAFGARATATDTSPPARVAVSGYVFPREQMPDYAVPKTPLGPVTFADGLTGDAARGMRTYSQSACIGCHRIAGNPMSQSPIGPDLTHVGSRTTIGAGLYPNTPRHLARWIKNSKKMKPGSLMPPLGKDEIDPKTGKKAITATLTDQQIADIVAYLMELR